MQRYSGVRYSHRHAGRVVISSSQPRRPVPAVRTRHGSSATRRARNGDGGGLGTEAASLQTGGPQVSGVSSMLELTYEADRQKGSVIKSQGLHRAPLSGGVKTATTRFDLPSPPVAVRNLVELAPFGHLCTMMSGMHHRRAGYPFGTLVDFAADGAGHPIFCLSPLAIHARNLLEEPRGSLVVQMPGWTGLANARVTIFGDIHQLPPNLQDPAREIFFTKHSQTRKERWVSGNFVYFRMDRLVDIYFVGGFGTVQWIDPKDYLASLPDAVVLDQPMRTLQALTDTFAAQLKELISPAVLKPGQAIDELLFISIDAGGVDIRLRCGADFSVERINFGRKVTTQAEAIDTLRAMFDALHAAGSYIKLG